MEFLPRARSKGAHSLMGLFFLPPLSSPSFLSSLVLLSPFSQSVPQHAELHFRTCSKREKTTRSAHRSGLLSSQNQHLALTSTFAAWSSSPTITLNSVSGVQGDAVSALWPSLTCVSDKGQPQPPPSTEVPTSASLLLAGTCLGSLALFPLTENVSGCESFVFIIGSFGHSHVVRHCNWFICQRMWEFETRSP